MDTIDLMAALKKSLRDQCPHTGGFTNLNVVDPQPGQPPEVLEGTCLGCGETRYFDREGAVYLTAQDARARRNPERRAAS